MIRKGQIGDRFLMPIRFGQTHAATYLCPLKKLYHKYGKIRAALKIKEL
jgi:hypothetical protein